MTSAATSVTNTAATLNGSANPDGTATTGWFRYDLTSPDLQRRLRDAGAGLGRHGHRSGQRPVDFAESISYPRPETPTTSAPSLRMWVGRHREQSCPSRRSTTPTDPEAPPALVTSTSATLKGFANPNGADTSGWFRYAITNPAPATILRHAGPASGGTDLGSGNSTVSLHGITGLAPGTTYYSCALGLELLRDAQASAVVTFTRRVCSDSHHRQCDSGRRARRPSSTARRPRAVGYHRLVPATAPPTRAPAIRPSGPRPCDRRHGSRLRHTVQTFSQNLTGLTPGTTYYACAIASNASGTGFGTILSFIAPLPPTVVTAAATAVMSASATLNGTANPNGTAATGWFRYATTSPGTCNNTFGTLAPASGGTSLGAGRQRQPSPSRSRDSRSARPTTSALSPRTQGESRPAPCSRSRPPRLPRSRPWPLPR